MKFLFLIIFSLLFGFASQDVFAETEITGILRIMDSYSTDPGPHPYIFWFTPDNQTTSYRLNPFIISSSVLDWSGERVKIKVADNGPLASSLNPNELFLDITSIQLVQKPLGNSILQLPASTRSVTLLSKYSNVATTPSEDPNTGPGQFNKPQGVAVDTSSNIYVADSFNHRIQKFDSNGNFLLKFGTGGSGNGQFAFPSGVAVDTSDNIFVVDNNNHRIQKFDSNGVFLLKFGKNGGDGTSGSTEGQFNLPFGIAVNSTGYIHVADTSNHRIQIFDSSGNFIKMFGWGVDTGANAFEICVSGCQSGIITGSAGGFAGPRGVAFDTLGNIFVADTGASRIQKFSSAGGFLSQFGSIGSGNGQFNQTRGVTIDSSNNIYVADTNNHRIQKFNSAGGYQSQFGSIGSGDSQFNSPEGIASGSIFVGDKNNNRLKKFDSNGVFQSVIGYDGSLSHDQAYYKGIFYDNPGSLKNYYLTSSYGKFTWNGNVSGWVTVPQTQAAYSNPSNFDLMITDAIASHETNVHFCSPTPVTNLILVFNGPVSPSTNTAFGSVGTYTTQMGGTWPTADGCNIEVSVSWEPDNGGFFCCGQTLDRGIGVTAHELGHNLTFEHTPPPPGSWVNAGPFSDPYHDPNSVMSNNRDREGPSPLIAGQRDDVGWMDAGNKANIANGNSATITLDFINQPEGGVNPQMITVPLSNGTSYIIEGHSEGLFSDTPQDKTGAIIYMHFPEPGNQYSYLAQSVDKGANYSLVSTAGTNSESQFDDAILEVSETYVDNVNNVTITTLSKTVTSVTVSVSNNVVASCSPPPGSDWIISTSCTLSQNVTADKNVIVQNNSKLTIPNGKTLFFHASTYHITIQSGTGILIQQGGSIKSSP
jgi:M6 family metalloprotease-like protein